MHDAFKEETFYTKGILDLIEAVDWFIVQA